MAIESKQVVLGHDIVAYLMRGLAALPAEQRIDDANHSAVSEMLHRADLVTLTFGLEPSCSLASREAIVEDA